MALAAWLADNAVKAHAFVKCAANCDCQVGSGVVGSASLDPLDDLFGLAKNTSMNTVRFFAHGINSSYALQTAPGALTCHADTAVPCEDIVFFQRFWLGATQVASISLCAFTHHHQAIKLESGLLLCSRPAAP